MNIRVDWTKVKWVAAVTLWDRTIKTNVVESSNRLSSLSTSSYLKKSIYDWNSFKYFVETTQKVFFVNTGFTMKSLWAISSMWLNTALGNTFLTTQTTFIGCLALQDLASFQTPTGLKNLEICHSCDTFLCAGNLRAQMIPIKSPWDLSKDKYSGC